jgi:microcystin-dependent protein
MRHFYHLSLRHISDEKLDRKNLISLLFKNLKNGEKNFMSEPFIGEIKIVAFNFAPRQYAQCDGALLPINQNQALFSILGTTYGGNGQTTFALPDMRGRVPVHSGNGIILGQKSGEENHTLITTELPGHNHQLNGSNQAGTLATPVSNYMPTSNESAYSPPNAPSATMVANEVSNTGGSQPHNNMQPYLVINVIIALQGIFPSRN